VKTDSFTLRKLFFAADGQEDAFVSFESGLNIIYGGSNAGKSFTLKAIDFMLGADNLKMPKQGEHYNTAYLWLDLPDETKVTLQRATIGGQFKLYEGHISHLEAHSLSGTVLAANLKGRSMRVSKMDTLPEFILRQIGINSVELVKNLSGEKNRLSIRLLSHYILISEEQMIAERSPIQIPDQRMSSLDKSLFRFLLTGQDDSSVVEVPSTERLSASRDGKIEIISELLATLDEKIKSTDTNEYLEDQALHITSAINNIHEEVAIHQVQLDAMLTARRELFESKETNESILAELQAMLSRLNELKSVYESDIDRLMGLEEGGFLLHMISGQPCVLCGADAIHQHYSDGLEEVEIQQKAALAEIEKIRIELTDLKSTIASLEAEVIGIEKRIPMLAENIKEVETKISVLRPQEKDVRTRYERAILVRADIVNRQNVLRQRTEYQSMIEKLTLMKVGRQKADGLSVDVSTSIAYDFSQTVKRVLEAWHFPDIEEVHFDAKIQDIVVNGRERTHNGKGIRAILHSAFKVALLIYCRDKKLPHPGFIVLDSPLLTYRGPLQFEKHGELSDDEVRFKQTALNEYFYDHLASLATIGQIIVLENQDPPFEILNKANILMFSGEKGTGRQGFFPPL
jgi:hypothetical protein